MVDMDRVDELPTEYRVAAKNTVTSVDRVRLAGKNIQEAAGEGEAEQKAVPDNAVNIDSRDEAPEDAEVIEGDRGGLYYVPADGEEGEDDEGGEVTTEEVGETAAAVTEEFMEKDMAPKPETPADLNNGFCNAVAEAIFEEAGGPEGMEIREAHTMGGRHQWVSYEGQHFDAEATEGVDSYEDLPVWDRFGSPGDAEVVKEGGDDQEEETVEVAGEEVAVGQDVTVSIEGSGSVSGTVDDIVDVNGTPWLMVEGEDSGRINQYSSEDIESVDAE